MPRYYHPSLAASIRPGTRETAAIGAGPATRKRGEHVPRGELVTDAGRTVSVRTVTVETGETTRRVSVWAIYDRGGVRIGQAPHNVRPSPPVGGWVQREIVTG